VTFLALETSTPYSVVCVGPMSGRPTGSRRAFAKGRGDRLTAWIEAVLKKAGVPLADVDVLGVGVGPGSFTGIRIGLSTAKGFAYALGKKCVAFSSLDAIAFGVKGDPPGPLAVAVDARRSNVYCRFYRMTENGLRRSSPPRMMPAKEFLRRVKRGTVVAGDAVRVLAQDLRRRGAAAAPEKFWYPRPEALAALTKESISNKDFQDACGLKAVYFYGQDCQVRRGEE